jgi:MoaA/NifB/PqqE/SkfB family radical SAM enzyme
MLKITPQGAVFYDRNEGAVVRLDRNETRRLYEKIQFPEDVSAPEVMHFEVSNRCNLNCSYCYVPKDGKELPTEAWHRIIDNVTKPKHSVFQVTFGGGEPFLRDDLLRLAEHAAERGVSRTVTTNGLLLPKQKASDLALFDAINVSYHGDEKTVEQALSHLAESGVKRGVNWVGRRLDQKGLERAAGLCAKYDAEMLILAYKTHSEPNEIIPPSELCGIARQLSGNIRVAADGASVGKCYCNYRFADVDSQGNLMPCSFIREPMGNLLENSFDEIWHRRKRERECPYFDLNNYNCWEHKGD